MLESALEGYGAERAKAAAHDYLHARMAEAKREGAHLEGLLARPPPTQSPESVEPPLDEEPAEPATPEQNETNGWTTKDFVDFVERVEALKEEGNREFEKARAARDVDAARPLAQDASILYLDALDVVAATDESTMSVDQIINRNRLLLTLHLNRAAAFMIEEEWKLGLKAANAALQLDNASIKALYRRGLALVGLGQFAEAEGDFASVLRLDPSNRAASHQLALTRKKSQRS